MLVYVELRYRFSDVVEVSGRILSTRNAAAAAFPPNVIGLERE